MIDAVLAFPDPQVLEALEPEELGPKLLLLTKKRFGSGMFLPTNLLDELYRPERAYGGRDLHRIELGLREAWHWLQAQGLIMPAAGTNGSSGWLVLTRRGLSFESDAALKDYTTAQQLPKALLHAAIRERVWLAFARGEYDSAVFQAMKAVEVSLRQAVGASGGVPAVKVARQAFHADTGQLTDPEAEGSEQQAIGDLFAGALGFFKNPQSHRDVNLDDPTEAAEIIMHASQLLRLIDRRTVMAASRGTA